MIEHGLLGGEVKARIVYWGIDGAGKTTNVRTIHAKLRSDHRGELRELPTRLDPSVTYQVLPIELGEVQGLRTRIQIIAVPGAPEHAPTRKQLLDQVDGVVFVIDSQPDRSNENLAAFDELRSALAAYGRSVEEIPLVVQYNKRDLADPLALEELHRKLDLGDVPVFEARASDGVGVLQTLTTISKQVIRARREAGGELPEPGPVSAPVGAPRSTPEAKPPARPAPTPLAPAAPSPVEHPAPPLATAPAAPAPLRPIERAILADAEAPRHGGPGEAGEALRTAIATEQLLDASWQELTQGLRAAPQAPDLTAPTLASVGLSIASVGASERLDANSVRVPLVLRDELGRERRLVLRLAIEPELVEPILAPDPLDEEGP